MNKRERVIAAFRGEETDHVPVCMWKHVPKQYWADDDQFAQYQVDAFKNTDVDFMKLSGDKYFPWPSPVLENIEKAEDLFKMEPLGALHPQIRGQISRSAKVVRRLGGECVSHLNQINNGRSIVLMSPKLLLPSLCRPIRLTQRITLFPDN